MGFFNTVFSFIMSAIITVQAALSLPVLSINFKVNTEPAVFESGDGMYTVIWSTTRPGSGYLTYTYDGKDYTVYDEIGGNVLTLDTIHAVRVPKQHIDNNEFVYHSQYIGAKLAYSAVKGKTIDSEPVKFKGYNGEKEINALVLSDIHANPYPAEKAAANFEAEPSLIILCGDIVGEMVSKSDFLNILTYAHNFSKGEIPVVYARGNHEPRGEFAPEMLKYFRTTSGGLYYTFNYGPLWSVVLDGGEDKEDNHPEYSGLVDFRSYIAQETKWLANITPDEDSAYKLCIVHQPAMDSIDGSHWLEMLGEMGIDASVSGHLHRFDLHFYDGSVPFRRMVTGGKNGNNGFIATMLTFTDGKIRAAAYNDNGELIADEYFSLQK